MPFHIQIEYIPKNNNIVSNTLSCYPTLTMTTTSISLIIPQAIGMLPRISTAAQDDDKYQELLNKVETMIKINKTNPLCLFFNELTSIPTLS